MNDLGASGAQPTTTSAERSRRGRAIHPDGSRTSDTSASFAPRSSLSPARGEGGGREGGAEEGLSHYARRLSDAAGGVERGRGTRERRAWEGEV